MFDRESLRGVEAALAELAAANFPEGVASESPDSILTSDARYRALVEQIPAVVFLAPMEGGLSEAYVSPQIETILGFKQDEWLSDPILGRLNILCDKQRRSQSGPCGWRSSSARAVTPACGGRNWRWSRSRIHHRSAVRRR